MVDSTDTFANDSKILKTNMRDMINKSKVISLEIKGQLIHMMHDKQMRQVMTDILNEVKQPQQINNLECLKIIADLLRFVLTLFVHEETADYGLFYAILECS